MSHDDRPATSPSPPAAALAAWLGQTHELLALTDSAGLIRWANPAFERVCGLAAGASLLSLAPQAGAENDADRFGTAHAALLAALASGQLDAAALHLRSASGAELHVDARISIVGDDRLWTLLDTTAAHELAAHAERQSELLAVAQEFGRLGLWEREISSGKGRWDRHVFGFLGVTPRDDGAPNRAEALQHTHPDDDVTGVYERSTLAAGRYSQRYRVVHPDGSVRRLHSQWEVKNAADGKPRRTVGIIMDDTEAYELARTLDSTTAHLALAVDLADIMIWRHDLKTGRVHYNERGFAMIGIPYVAEGLTLAEARAYTHPDDAPLMSASAEKALATGQPVDVETRCRRADGSWCYLLTRRAVERDANGVVTGFVGVSLDVTERVEQSRRANELAQRLAIATRVARVGIWTTTLGTDDTVWDAQMFELFDIVGAPRPPTRAEWLKTIVHPDDARRVGDLIRAHRPDQDGAFEAEFRIRKRDGRTRWIVLRADLDRNVVDGPRAFGIAMDVTDRHEAQSALHAASERAALIARHAGIGTWETDEQGGPARWDEQMFRLRGLEPGGPALERDERLALVHPDDRDHVLDSQPELHGTSQGTAYEFRIRWPDGQYRWIASRSAPLMDAEGRVVRRVGVNWDITDHKNAELARQQALLAEQESQAKSQFLSRMSHELRTPLNAVLGFTQLLQLDARRNPNSEQLAKLNHIRAAGEHLLALINDALDLSSLEAGTLKLDLQPVSIALAVARAVPLVEELAATNHVTIRTGRLDGAALADQTRLHQVLLNLLSNAIKYNRQGGEVVIESILDGAKACISVRDTGRGMNENQLAHLFEPFNRLGMEGAGIEGSGIGMTIARALVEGMRGRIDVASELGHGTVFDVTLPSARVETGEGSWFTDLRDDEKLARDPFAIAPGQRSGRLLYIEDNAVNVLLVDELLTRLPGLQLVSEATGAAGVARARAMLPDLVLVDMQLPDFDGFEVLRQLRSHHETASIPCIALSANAMPTDIARGLAAGFEDYWTKPIRFKEFLESMARRFPAGQS